jgi:hypothetical protein
MSDELDIAFANKPPEMAMSHRLKGYEAARSTPLTINLIIVEVSLDFRNDKRAAYVLAMFCRPIVCTPETPYYLRLQIRHLASSTRRVSCS